MKHLKVTLFIPVVILLFSCNNSSTNSKAADTTAVATPPPPPAPMFKPYDVMTIQAKVKNFDKWKKAHEADDSLRKAYGITDMYMAREMKDSNMVFVLSRMDDMDKARTYSKLPNLKEVSKESGLVGSLGFSYGKVFRQEDSATDTEERLGVAHHVKNFDAWLKSYDSAVDMRTTNGIIERSIVRSLIDSNMVYISFLVTDVAKAKARMEAPDLKKRMTDAGVDSPPTIRWYKVAK
ncbi:MAG TPA: hypothetical protein VMI35_15470 [Puia sp.]|nr:hypothetical protein [Puia sp.]